MGHYLIWFSSTENQFCVDVGIGFNCRITKDANVQVESLRFNYKKYMGKSSEMKMFDKMWLIIFMIIVLLGTENIYSETYIVGGDNLVGIGVPIDSETTIRGNFEALKKDWGLNRVWWRCGQQKYMYEYADVVSDDTVTHARIWRWFFEHNKEASKAVDICKDLGLEVWLWTGLFEFGASEYTGGNGHLPFTFEHRLRKEHPEWLPVNKYGTRQQAGPIEFCYPEARAAYIQTLKDFLLQEGYEGIVFYTYAENFGTRYLDEFGFNQPIVDEFRNRYGVDIRTEPFDKEAWAALRGEYVTQFLRELKTALKPHNIKVGIQLSSKEIDGQKPRPDLPSAWPGIWSTQDKQRIGRILMDWRTWVDDGLVDELNVFYPGSTSVAVEVRDYCQQHNPAVQVSMYLAGVKNSDTYPDNVRRIAYFPEGRGTPADIQSGFPPEQIGDPPNNYPNPAKTLREGDKWQKRQVLHLASIKRLSLATSDIAIASTDDDVFVRSMAIRALRASKLAEAIPFVEARLNDTENSVRCLAAVELGNLTGANSLQKIFDAIVSGGNWQYNFSAIPQSLQAMKENGALGTAQKLLLRTYFTHPDVNVRQSVVYSLNACGIISEYKDELLNMAIRDTDNYCKTLAMYQLTENFGITETYDVLKTNIESANPIIQVRAAESLGYYTEAKLSEVYQERVLNLLLILLKQYTAGNNRVDRKWGWQIVGNSLLALGIRGESSLEKLMCETTDQGLADIAWRVLYIRQYRNKYVTVTEEQDEIAHRKRSFIGKGCK